MLLHPKGCVTAITVTVDFDLMTINYLSVITDEFYRCKSTVTTVITAITDVLTTTVTTVITA